VATGVAGGPRQLVQALLLGAAIDVTIRAAFHTWDPVWQAGAVPWLVTIGSTGAAIVLAIATPTSRRDADDLGAGWFAFGAFLFLHVIVLQNPGAVGSRVGTGLAASTAAIVLADAGAAAVVRSFRPGWVMRFQVVTVAAGVAFPLITGPLALIAIVVLTICSAVTLVLATSDRRSLPGVPPMLAAAGGALLFAALLVAYQKDRPLPVPALVLPGLAAILLVVPTVIRRVPPPAPARVARSASLAPLALLVVPVALWLGGSVGRDLTGGSVARAATLVDYNVRFGVDEDGRVDPEAIAAAIDLYDPAVVVLQEAGRGLPVDGMTDLVEWLSWRLGMSYICPAQVHDRFRTTILYRPDIELESASHGTLPASAGPVRSYVRARFEDVAGGSLQIIAAHLSGEEEDPATRDGQIQAILQLVGASRRTVIVGDLNASLRSTELTILHGAGFTSIQSLTGEREPTFPEEGIIADHILLGRGLTASDMAVPEVGVSDHLPVVVTISPS
jgi:endonuclease/exonuclease/phosphatase family metal-dependent hydrolase